MQRAIRPKQHCTQRLTRDGARDGAQQHDLPRAEESTVCVEPPVGSDERREDDPHHEERRRCEEERLSEIYDEPSICGRKLVVLRWNPDGYQPPAGQAKVTGKEKRMAIYLALHRKLRQHQPSDLITVYYLFYSKDNPRICRQYPVHMINSMADVEAL